MRNLFEYGESAEYKDLPRFKVANEMIDYQPNDYIVNTLVDLYQSLINEVNENNSLKSASDIQLNPKTKDILKQIDFVIEERFGIPVKHVACNGGGYGVLITPIKDEYTISGKSYGEFLRSLRDHLVSNGINETNTKDKKDVDVIDLHNDYNNRHLYYNYQNAVHALRKKVKADSVIIDRKKAKIIGLPKEHINYIMHDLFDNIFKVKLTARELTGIILHEIGHAFTYIEYAYRTINSVSVVMDTFVENIEKKNNTPKNSLILAYEKVIKDLDKNKLKDTETIPTAIYIADSYIKANKYDINETLYYTIDSEQLADQFSGRFGMGQDLVSGLEKIVAIHGSLNPFVRVYYDLFAAIRGNLLMMVLETLVSTILSVIYLPLITLTCIILWVLGSIFSILPRSDTDVDNEATYDALKKRYVRIRNELVRALRNMNIDKKLATSMLNSIDNIDAIIKNIPEPIPGLIEKLFRKYSSSSQKRLEVRNIENLLEDLDANNLYVASAKLSTLK